MLLLSVHLCTVLQAWNLDLWRLRPDTLNFQPRPMFYPDFSCDASVLNCWSWVCLIYSTLISMPKSAGSYSGDPLERLVPPIFMPSSECHRQNVNCWTFRLECWLFRCDLPVLSHNSLQKYVEKSRWEQTALSDFECGSEPVSYVVIKSDCTVWWPCCRGSLWLGSGLR